MATSSIPAFKAALLARLQADAALADVLVTWGYPHSTKPGSEWVNLGATTGIQATAAVGQKRREETYDQTVTVSCTSALKNEQQALSERAFAIAAAVEDSLRTWSMTPPFFDGVVRVALVTGMDLDEYVSNEEREARITLRISCAQRI
ncbi:MAG: hypothetical protein AB7O78_01685 [Thermoleophilia bacterium]